MKTDEDTLAFALGQLRAAIMDFVGKVIEASRIPELVDWLNAKLK